MNTYYTNTTKTTSALRLCLSVLLALILSMSAADKAVAQCTGCVSTITSNTSFTIPAGQTYCLNRSGTYTQTITLNANSTLCIYAGTNWNGATINVGGTPMTINNYGTSSKNLTLPSGVTFNNYGTYTGTLTMAAGSFASNSGTFSGAVGLNGGTITNNATMSGTITMTAGLFTNNGTISNVINQNGGVFINTNSITGTLNQNTGLFTNNAGATISGTVAVKDSMINNGTLSNTVTVSTGDLTNNGNITGAIVTNNAAAIIDNYGSVTGAYNPTAGVFSNYATFSPSSLNLTGGTFINGASGTITMTSTTTVKTGFTFTNNGVMNASSFVANSGSIVTFQGVSQTINGNMNNSAVVNLMGTLTITGAYSDGTGASIKAIGNGNRCNLLNAASFSALTAGTFNGNGYGLTLSATPLLATRLINGATGPVAAPGSPGSGLAVSVSAFVASGSFSSSVGGTHMVIRYIGTSPSADVPASNTAYAVGDMVGSSTVVAFTTGNILAGNSFTDNLPSTSCGQNVYYRVFAYSGTQPCEVFNTTPLTATVAMTIPAASITPGSSTTFCAGGSVSLVAGGGNSYSWSTGAATTSITATTAATYIVTATAVNGCTASDNEVVTVNSAAPITPYYNINGTGWVNGTTPILCAGGALQFGSQPLTAGSWYTTGPSGYVSRARDTMITGLQAAQAGAYNVTFTDGANGCSSTKTYNVTVNPLPVPAVNSPTICAGQSATLTANGGGTYAWSTTETTATINPSPSASTFYAVTVTSPAGCKATGGGTVTVNPIPVAAIAAGGPTTFCTPGSVVLTASGGGTYVWNTTSTAASITASTSGTYVVTVTHATNGCKATASQSVTANATPTATIAVSGATTFCAGGNVTLTAGGGGTYAWSTGATTAAISATTSGTYTVTVTGAGGCFSTASRTITVNPLPAAAIAAGGPTTFCTPGSVVLTASGGGTYVWNTTPGATTASITASATGTYTVTVTHPTNGCTASASQSVTANTTPTATITASGPTTVCAGGSVTLTAGGGGTYAWSNGATTAATTVNSANIYTVTVTGAGSCFATASTTVTVSSLPVPAIAATSPNTFCAGIIDTLTASGGTSYAWSNGTSGAVNKVTASGTYIVTVTNASSCTATASRTITVNAAPAAASTSAVSCFRASKTITASGGTSYVWNNGATTASITPSPVPSVTTTYTVTVTNAAGCTATANGTITVDSFAATTTNPAVCEGTIATMKASGGATYVWSTGSTTDTIRSLTDGVFTVTATDALGCTASTTGIITVNPLPTPTVNNQTICSGDTAILTATGGAIYAWSNGKTGATIKVTAAGTYTVTVTNMGSCTATASGTVSLTAPMIVSASNGVICSGNPATITATGGATYAWSNGANTASTSVSVAGTYTVTITSASGCKLTASSNVTTGTLPVAAVTSPSICAGKIATPTASGGGTYLWSTSATSASISVSPAATTAYTVTVSNASGCSVGLTSTVTVNANPLATATGGVICTGTPTTPATLVASGGTSYLWSNSVNTASNPVSVIGTYGVTVTNAAGCTATASATATTAIKPLPAVSVSSAGVCSGSSIILTATPASGVSYAWSNGIATAKDTVAPAATTAYTVTVTNASTCTASATGIATIFPLPTTAPNSNSPVLLNGTINLTSSAAAGTTPYTYSWSGPSAFTSTAANPTVASATPAKGGIYSITVTDNKGCTATGSTTVILNYASPGGLTSNTALWLYGDSVIASAGNVTGWYDASQLNNDITAVHGTAPTLVASAVNFHPAVNFTGAGGLLGAFLASIISNEATAFVVTKANTTSTTSSGIFSVAGAGLVDSTNTNGAAFFARGVNSIYTQRNSTNLGNYTNANAIGQYHMATSMISSSATRDSFFVEGRAQTIATATASNFAASRYTIGERIGATTYGKYFNGQIAEVALFNRQVTLAERNQVESYLALKYGFTLDQTVAKNYIASNGVVYWNATTNGTYKNNIFGVGIDNVCALNQTQSVSINNSILSINSASALTFYSFLMVADNAGANTLVATTGLPNNMNAKISLTWKVSQTGTRTPANYVFDKSSTNFGPYATVASGMKVFMLVDSDANSVYESYIVGTVSGTTTTFNANLRNGAQFTFGFKGDFDFGDAPGVPTLLASNGPSHLIVPGVYLGALIDAENDGQVSANSMGDDSIGLADEDGINFNSGVSTSVNIVTMGSNSIIVTASTAGYLNAWADFNQDNTYGGGSEYAIKNVALVAGANTITFNVSDSVQYGKTSMRFRFATGIADAITPTGLAPNGEVEDYQVYVTAPLVGGCTNGFQNPDFELGPGPSSYIITDQTNLPYWRTTAPDKQVEMWRTGFNGVNAYSGNYFMELEANQLGALYQDVYTTPGATVLWSFAHRGRAGVDSCNLKIGAPGSTVTVRTVGDGTAAWGVYTGTYIVPAGQYITRFEFNALFAASGDLSVGNFLDKVAVSSSFDYGDAPDSYGTLKASNGAFHALSSNLYLGANVSCDLDGAPGASATGDTYDDGITFPSVCANCNTFNVTVSVFNNTGKVAKLAGWVDFNKNGLFDAGERKAINIPSSATQQTVTLPFTVTTFSSAAASTYARFRLATDSNDVTTATGLARDGEVEDYKVPCVAMPTPIPTAPTPVCARGPMALTASGSAPAYSWTGPNGYTSNTQNPTVPSVGSVDSGSYRVYAIYANGCATDSAVKVVISNCFVSLSGSMLDDANGNGLQNGTEIYTNRGQTFYAVLVSSTNTVLDKSLAASNGAFSFASVPAYTVGMKIIPSNTNLAVGATATSASWPTNWVGTKGQYGLNNNSGLGVFNSPNQVPVSVDIKNVTNVVVGYDQLPSSTPKTYTIPRPHIGSAKAITAANGLGMFGGTDPEDGAYNAGSTFTIADLTGLNGNKLFYDANGDGILQNYEEITGYTVITNVDPTKFMVKFTGNASLTTSFKYATRDAAGQVDPAPATYMINWTGGALPVKLISFTAEKYNETQSQLRWSTASEVNNDHFEVERSADGISWTKIAEVKGNGTTNEQINYSIVDESPLEGVNYYRLKQVDYDGKFEYSPIVTVDFDGVRQPLIASTLNIYPNPLSTGKGLNITLKGNDTIKNIVITNQVGQIVYSNDVQDIQDYEIQGLDLAAGIYIVNITSQTNANFSGKIMVTQ